MLDLSIVEVSLCHVIVHSAWYYTTAKYSTIIILFNSFKFMYHVVIYSDLHAHTQIYVQASIQYALNILPIDR